MLLRDDYNAAEPMIMHIDLNSCFATIEQQSRPLLRHKPVAVVNRRTEQTAIVTASYEAKQHGAKVGMKLQEAKRLVPGLIALESDPPKYSYVYRKLLAIMQDYSASVVMKSIDEGVIDFHAAPKAIVQRGLVTIGKEIKQRLFDEIGCAMRCNVGIGTNRFLAKTAAGMDKPDGLTCITAETLRATMGRLRLTDLTGIADRNEQRLQAVGIFTPLELLDAREDVLRKIVFKSVNGTYWHQRMRGWEVDDMPTKLGRVGRQYVLEKRGLSHDAIMTRFHHLCESVGARLRGQDRAAYGVYVYVRGIGTRWHASRLAALPFASDVSIWQMANHLLNDAPITNAREIGIHCYNLTSHHDGQLTLWENQANADYLTSTVVDAINRRYGQRTIHAAATTNTDFMEAKVPFGSTRYL